MKKVILLAASLLLMAFQANAQLTADAGYIHAFERFKANYKVLQGTVEINDSGTSSLDGFYAGAKYGIALDGITEGLSVAPGANFSFLFGKEEGIADVMNVGSVSHVTEVALNIPVLVQYAYELGQDFKLTAYAGPTFQCGILNRAIDGEDNPSLIYNQYKTVERGLLGTDALGVTHWYDGDIPARNRINLFLGLGVGFEVAQKVQLNVGYDFGLFNLSSGDGFKITRSQLKIGLGYIF